LFPELELDLNPPTSYYAGMNHTHRVEYSFLSFTLAFSAVILGAVSAASTTWGLIAMPAYHYFDTADYELAKNATAWGAIGLLASLALFIAFDLSTDRDERKLKER
jgi:hypothetical protein